MEVGFSKQASKLVLSLEVSLSRSHSPTRRRGLEDPTPASPPHSVPGRQVREARPTPAAGPAQRHLQAPKLGHSGSRAAGSPPWAAQKPALTRRAESAAPSAPRPPARRREAPWRGAPRPPGTRGAASPARPCWAPSDAPAAATREAAGSCTERTVGERAGLPAPRRPACLSRVGLTWGAEKGAGGVGGKRAERREGREVEREEGGGGGRKKRFSQRRPPGPASAAPGSPAGRGGRAGGAARAGTRKLQCPWPQWSAPCPARPTAAAEFFTTPQSATAGATLRLALDRPSAQATQARGGGGAAGGRPRAGRGAPHFPSGSSGPAPRAQSGSGAAGSGAAEPRGDATPSPASQFSRRKRG